MNKSNVIIVVFNQISRSEFFKRLSWDYMVSAWSNSIRWEPINSTTIKLYLSGIDGLDTIFITRRNRGDQIFIGARNSERELIQTGVWEYESDNELAVCYRRIYKRELANILQDRLVDFCCSTFLH